MGSPGAMKYLGGCCRPLYHGQKCHVLRFGFHWVLGHVSRKNCDKKEMALSPDWAALADQLWLYAHAVAIALHFHVRENN